VSKYTYKLADKS